MNTNQPAAAQPTDCSEGVLTEKQQQELADQEKQEQYQKEYLAQLRQQQCPGCGETEMF